MKNRRSSLILNDTILLLGHIRIEMRISHQALATKIGISRPAISHIENGKRRPTLLMALKLAQGLDMELSTILSQAEKMHPQKTANTPADSAQ